MQSIGTLNNLKKIFKKIMLGIWGIHEIFFKRHDLWPWKRLAERTWCLLLKKNKIPFLQDHTIFLSKREHPVLCCYGQVSKKMLHFMTLDFRESLESDFKNVLICALGQSKKVKNHVFLCFKARRVKEELKITVLSNCSRCAMLWPEIFFEKLWALRVSEKNKWLWISQGSRKW